ncbi:MAG: Hsp20/alpha crystallin family protein [Verrucomicrobiota bacterium]
MAMCKVSSTLHFSKRSFSSSGKEAEAQWIPNTDVYVMDGGLVIKVELAGMRREDLELSIEKNRLRISGQRPDGCRSPKCKFLVMEINYGAFETVIELPTGYDLTQAKAAYQNGFLRIDVPVAADSPPKRLSVQISGA